MNRFRNVVALAALASLAVVVFSDRASTPVSAQTKAGTAAPANPVVVVDVTPKGIFEIEMLTQDAPKSVEKILALVRRGFYRGQRILYATPGSIQFGDPATRDMTKKDTWGPGGSGSPVGVAETSKRSFDRGIVGFAYRRGSDPRTADSQLFILRIANPGALNGKYAAVGRVIGNGMAVVDKLEEADRLVNVTVK